MKKQTFGVEIEMVLNRTKAAGVIANYLNGTIEHTFDGYKTIEITAEDNRVWKVVRDASINACDSDRCEIVTPVLN